MASKDSKILYPGTYWAEGITQYMQNYIIEKNAALPDSYRFGK